MREGRERDRQEGVKVGGEEQGEGKEDEEERGKGKSRAERVWE